MKEPNILITGVGRGFGLELTREYCRLGWRVFGVLRNKLQRKQMLSEFGEKFVPIVVDLRNDAAVTIISQCLQEKAKSLSILINNAGIVGTGHHIEETSCNEIQELFNVHCCGAIRCLQAALPALRKSERATIVNVSSRLGSISKVSSGNFDHIQPSYGMRMVKSALNMFSASLHRELKEAGIAVFAVHPGAIRTRMGSRDANLSAKQAAKRFVTWLPKIRQEQDFGYFEAGADDLPF